MEFVIGTDGTIKRKKIIRSSGFPKLDKLALEAVAKCKFHPGTQYDQPMESKATLQYVWTPEVRGAATSSKN